VDLGSVDEFTEEIIQAPSSAKLPLKAQLTEEKKSKADQIATSKQDKDLLYKLSQL